MARTNGYMLRSLMLAVATAIAPLAGDVSAQQMDHSHMADHESPTPRAIPPESGGDEPKEPVPPVTDADRAAAFPDVSGHKVADNAIHYLALLDQIEWQDADGGAQNWDAKGWVGTDLDRAWLRTEGEREDGRTESAFAEVLYGRAISRWWEVVAGVRNDFRPGSSRTWGAIGVQGLAPYKFDIEATAYIGESGRTHARFEAEYDLLLTNRLILQPQVELELFGEDDRRRRIGAGLSTVELSLRLRYEIRREFAPYLGIAWSRSVGDTADFARDESERVKDTRLIAGIRFWF